MLTYINFFLQDVENFELNLLMKKMFKRESQINCSILHMSHIGQSFLRKIHIYYVVITVGGKKNVDFKACTSKAKFIEAFLQSLL